MEARTPERNPREVYMITSTPDRSTCSKNIIEIDTTTSTPELSTDSAHREVLTFIGKAIAYLKNSICQMNDFRSTIEDLKSFKMENENATIELRNQIDSLKLKIIEGEKLRREQHNTIMELKGNIRVFCRVRPSEGVELVSFPTELESLGRRIDLAQYGQKMSFSFDQVFRPGASQEDVFVEISQLVQSALDGYKVCIFAYGQTGSGKTHTMMGKPELLDQKGLIPRSIEYIFEMRQNLQPQGWKYEIKVSMLEIYNEKIRDMLAPNIERKHDLTIKHVQSCNEIDRENTNE